MVSRQRALFVALMVAGVAVVAVAGVRIFA